MSLDNLVTIEDLQIDLGSRIVRRSDLIITLTRTEWNLLQCLAANAGRVMLNAELLSKVWGPEYIGDLQYLRVWVSRLRAKIERDPSQPTIIRTFPGVGYMLNAEASAPPQSEPADDEDGADETPLSERIQEHRSVGAQSTA